MAQCAIVTVGIEPSNLGSGKKHRDTPVSIHTAMGGRFNSKGRTAGLASAWVLGAVTKSLRTMIWTDICRIAGRWPQQ